VAHGRSVTSSECGLTHFACAGTVSVQVIGRKRPVIPFMSGLLAPTAPSRNQAAAADVVAAPMLRRLWRALGTVFAGPWPAGLTPGQLRAHAKDLVKTVREFRNRLFHCEPAWKKFGVQTEADALQHLNEKLTRTESLIRLIHPEKHRLLDRNGLLGAARRACTQAEIRRFQHVSQTYKIKSLKRLRDLVDRCARDNVTLNAKVFIGSQRTFHISPR
jgi:hypothetical protein